MKHDVAGRTNAPPPPALDFLSARLEALRSREILRERPEPLDATALSFCSNDYLGLAARASVEAPRGAGASRLVSGERSHHVQLEDALARWLGTASALVFSSGYAANVSIVGALAEQGDVVVSDELNHASIIDGARLSRARVVVTPHLDTAAVARALALPRAGRAWVVTESYFSMDADSPDLAELRRLCDREFAALVVDEAHALGVLGPEGRGLCAEAGVVPDVLIGTLGKALGASGAFAAGCVDLVSWLWNSARSFVFSTGMSPVVAASALDSLEMAVSTPALRARTLAAAEQLRRGLGAMGIEARGFGHIIPWVVGAPERAVAVALALRERGVHVQAIRPPSVPQGSSRLRFTVTAKHASADIERALVAIEEVLRSGEGRHVSRETLGR